MKNILRLSLVLTFIIAATSSWSQAQEQLSQNYNQLMEIPGVVEMEASPAHLYVLSETEGLAVFRVYQDSLQWLYTSSGMQRRGRQIEADIRFAYLFGVSRRLTVLEPTSVLGVYSTTLLPEKPNAVARLGNNLYIALGNSGLGMISLETPETVDSNAEMLAKNDIGNAAVIDVRSTELSKQLFVLTDAPSLLIYNLNDMGLELSGELKLNLPISNIFIDGEQVWGSTAMGEIYEIRSSGLGKRVGITNEPIQKIRSWNNRLFIRTTTGRVWHVEPGNVIDIWKDDQQAGNYLASSSGNLWISEYDKISRAVFRQPLPKTQVDDNGGFRIKHIPNQVVTYPNPLMLALEMEGNSPSGEVEFSYRSNADNAKIRSQGFYWQPTINQVGRYWFRIVAKNASGQIDSTRFIVDVRSFNSPPRFSPIRKTSIAVNQPYQIQYQASDPENPESSLIRYIGVDLPEGATINEHTGVFKWTPTERQIGETTFRIIATDKLGAASSVDVTLNVMDISRDSRK